MSCFDKLRRKFPLNYFCLFAFTGLFSVVVGVATASYDVEAIAIAAGVTTATVRGAARMRSRPSTPPPLQPRRFCAALDGAVQAAGSSTVHATGIPEQKMVASFQIWALESCHCLKYLSLCSPSRSSTRHFCLLAHRCAAPGASQRSRRSTSQTKAAFFSPASSGSSAPLCSASFSETSALLATRQCQARHSGSLHLVLAFGTSRRSLCYSAHLHTPLLLRAAHMA